MVQYKTKGGSPTATINFYTRDKLYELHSKIGDPNSDFLSVRVNKDLNSPTGSFSITLTPKMDEEGKTWKDKLEVFDYVEIFLKGIDDEKEKIVMRGVIDNISIAEAFQEFPQRSISVDGRDLGILLSDFQIWYNAFLDPVSDTLRMLRWLKNPKRAYRFNDWWRDFIQKWKTVIELTVGRPGSGTNQSSEKGLNIEPSETRFKNKDKQSGIVNLATKVDVVSYPLMEDLSTYLEPVKNYEGSFWNLFQSYQDVPFHEMFIYDTDDNAKLVIRPSKLKDMKSNLYKGVYSAMNQIPEGYPDDWSIEPIDKISSSFNKNSGQLRNNFFVYPEYGAGLSKVEYMMSAAAPYIGNISESINPFFSIKKDDTEPSESRFVNRATGQPQSGVEPLTYIGRYGLRKYEVPVKWVGMEPGQVEAMNGDSKDPDHPAQAGKWPDESRFLRKPGSTLPNTVIPSNLSQWEARVDPAAKSDTSNKAMVYAVMGARSQGKEQYRATLPSIDDPAYMSPERNEQGLMAININDTKTPYSGGTDPEQNINYGASRIDTLTKRYPGESKKIAAAYWDQRATERAITDYNGAWEDHLTPEHKALTEQTDTLYQDYNTKLKDYEKKPKTTTQEEQKQGGPETSSLESKEQENESSETWRNYVRDKMSSYIIEMNWILICWYLHNEYLLNGSINIRGTTKAIIGTYVWDKDGPERDQMEYYVEGVSHSFDQFSTFTTSLTVTRGQYKQAGLWGHGVKGKYYFDEAVPLPPIEKMPDIQKAVRDQAKQETLGKQKARLVRLPDETPGCGYHYYSPYQDMRYGTPETIAAIIKAGQLWAAPGKHPTGPLIQVGDISQEYGGNGGHHGTHLYGTNADFRPCRTDNINAECPNSGTVDEKTNTVLTWVSFAQYSSSLTNELCSLLRTVGFRISYNDPAIAAGRLIGHFNHIHTGRI